MTRPYEEIPRVRGLPWLGSALQMNQEKLRFFRDRVQALGPVFRVRLFGHEYVAFCGLDANRFFMKNSDLLAAGEIWTPFNQAQGVQNTLINLDGPDHAAMRQAVGPAMSGNRLYQHGALAARIAAREASRRLDRGPFPAIQLTRAIVVEQIGQITTGQTIGAQRDDLARLVRASLLSSVVGLRFLSRLPGHRRLLARLAGLKGALFSDGRGRDAIVRPDYADMLLALHRASPQILSADDLEGNGIGPLLAGYDTAASLCAFLLYEILRDPDLARRVVAEARALRDAPSCRRDPDGLWSPFRDARDDEAAARVNRECIQRLPLLGRALKEALRFYPIGSLLMRQASRPFEFGGFQIPGGQRVLMVYALVHFQAEHYPDPLSFDPDRFAPDRTPTPKPGTYQPFGLGAHACLGRNFAAGQILIALATLFLNFSVEMAPGAPRKITQPSLPVIRPKDSFRVALRRAPGPIEGGGAASYT